MIDFRYHLVSLVAVFLALSVGLVLGTTVLDGPVRAGLGQDGVADRDLPGEVSALREELEAADAFALAAAPRLVGGALADQRVLLVTTPDTPDDLAGRVTPLLEQAGARVTGSLRLLPALSDPAQRALVEDVVAQVVPAGVQLPGTGPVERATAELAAALSSTPDGTAVEPEQAQAVVSAFGEADLAAFSPTEQVLQPATLALVLTGAPDGPPSPQEQGQQLAVLTMAGALDARSRGAVVAGPTGSASDGAIVRVLRDESAVADGISSVDHADRGSGLVTVVLALAEQLRGGAGQYGTGEGASPDAPPLPSP